jgi:hypothetical protein
MSSSMPPVRGSLPPVQDVSKTVLNMFVPSLRAISGPDPLPISSQSLESAGLCVAHLSRSQQDRDPSCLVVAITLLQALNTKGNDIAGFHRRKGWIDADFAAIFEEAEIQA